MIVWFTSGPGADRTGCGRSCWFARAVPGRDRRAVAVPVALGRAAQDRVRAAARVARRDRRCVTPGLFREFRRANLVVFVESINTFDGTIRNVFLHSIDERQGRRRRSRGAGTLRGGAEWRPFHRAERRPPLRRQAGHRRLPGRRVREARAADRAGRGPRHCPTSTKAMPTATLARRRRPGRARRAVLAALGADLGAGADAARGPAGLCQSAHGPLVQPHSRRRSCTCSTATASTSCRASSPRGGSISGPGSRCRTSIALVVVVVLLPPPAARSPDCSRAPPPGGAEAAGRLPMKTLHALHRPRGAARDAADLRRAGDAVRVLRPDPRAGRRRARTATRSPRRCCTSRCSLPSRLYELLPGRRADRHAVRDGAARRQLRIHGDARVGRVAAAGRCGR